MPIKRSSVSERKPRVIVGGIYRHYKGGKYVVTDIAVHTETEEEMIIYKDAFTGAAWVRPASMWDDIVETGGHRVRRFVLIADHCEEEKRERR